MIFCLLCTNLNNESLNDEFNTGDNKMKIKFHKVTETHELHL